MSRVFTITEGLQNLGALRTGGQGSVYKAMRMGEIITAVKLLPTPIHSESPTDKNYMTFMNEVQKLKKVNANPNPNVVKILSSGLTDTGNLPFIEMEFIEGPDLEELLQPPHDPVFTIKETIKVAEHLSHALAHCHRLDVKHGDIKSNNVKFNIHSGNYVLLDFGLAVMSDEQRRTSLRQAGAIEFMAPEQNEGKMLFQTDVYSFGVILFELLAGTVPFPLREGGGETARNLVMLAHMETKPPDLLALRKEKLPSAWSDEKKEFESLVPDWLHRMICRCLEKKTEQRFANGMELHDYVVRNSISSSNGSVITEMQQLQEENEKLKRERTALQQQVDRLKNADYRKQEFLEAHPPRKSTGGTALALILTAAVIAIIVFFVLRSKGENNVVEPAATQQPVKQRQPVGQYKVMAAKAYFFNAPDSSTRRTAYMIPSNDVITALDEKNGFIYTEFTNSQGQTSKGWLRLKDLVTLSDWNNNQANARPSDQDIIDQLKEAKQLLANNQVGEALYIYSFLAKQEVPEAMYQYANLALQQKNQELTCGEAIVMMDKASEAGYAPAKRTLGFLYIFAENPEVLAASNYAACAYEKNVVKGTQLLIQAIRSGDSTAKKLMEEINQQRTQDSTQLQ